MFNKKLISYVLCTFYLFGCVIMPQPLLAYATEKAESAVVDNTKDYIPAHDAKHIDKDFKENMKKTMGNKKVHPRILCTPEEFQTNLDLYKNGDPYLTQTVNNVLQSADKWLTVGDSKYELYDGLRLVRNERYIIKDCAFAYAVTGQQKYFDRMYRAIEVASSWPDWNPSHFLDVAELAYAYALAYDLCYDSFTEDQKRVLRNGLMKNGIEEGIKSWRRNSSVSQVRSNWQEVCAGGIGMAAIALIDEPGYYDICSEFICHSIRTLPIGLDAYGPDGAFPEGMAYWQYASKFFFNYDKSLFNTFGTDYDLSKLDGLDKTGFFPILSNGPITSFNYSDSSESAEKTSDACMYYLAQLYDIPALATYHYTTRFEIGVLEDFCLYNKDIIGDDYKKLLPLDVHYRGEQDIVYTRATHSNDAGAWLAYKGGFNNAKHGDLDIGQFVLDMQGVRWFCDVGSGEYNSEGYFIRGVDGPRWNYYRKRAEGHSTLVINPDDKPDQYPLATGVITDFKTSDWATYGILDMTEAYYEDVTKATRGFALINGRNEVIIQDEIISEKPVELYSFFITKQEIELTSNPKVAYIKNDLGKKIRLDITSPEDASWSVMDNKPLPTSPDPKDNSITGNSVAGQKLAIHLESAKSPTISVHIRNVYENIEETDAPNYKKLSDWDCYLEDKPHVDMLYLDGLPIEGFYKGNSTYSYKGHYGTVSADYDKTKYDVKFIQANKVGETACCVVTDKISGNSAYYHVMFDNIFVDVDPSTFEKIQISSVEASDIPEPENVPENTFDADYKTRWAAENDVWIIWELDGTHKLEQILLSFWKGNIRATKFDIYTSTDKENWTLVYSGGAAGNTEQLETFKFNEVVEAKYVKYHGFGNNQNGWNSILEVYFPQMLEDFIDIKGHWAENEVNQMRLLNYIKGTSKTTFSPESDITVAEFVALIARCLDIKEKEITDSVFTDVNENMWYAKIINSAYVAGVIPEILVKNGKISPDKAITREEMSVILSCAYARLLDDSKLMDINLENYADYNEIDTEYRPYIAKTLAARLIKGRAEATIAPKSTATRAEAATILKRLYIAKLDSLKTVEFTQSIE